MIITEMVMDIAQVIIVRECVQWRFGNTLEGRQVHLEETKWRNNSKIEQLLRLIHRLITSPPIWYLKKVQPKR